MMVTSEARWVERSWPPVWDLTHEVYFRPEPPGLLISPCDASPSEPPGETPDAAALDLLAEKVGRCFPRLKELEVASVIAGLRTFAPDGNMVLGEDPCLRGFFWCAGFGGSPDSATSASRAGVDRPPAPCPAPAR